MPEQLTLFDTCTDKRPVQSFKPLRFPIWTENKAKLIERYLFLFVMITRHGTYIDGFAGPQKSENPETWAAKLVLETEPRWMRNFYLFDSNPAQIDYLNKLRNVHPDRNVEIYPGDFNELVPGFLSARPIKEKEACFCLLDQRTFECHWATMETLAKHKTTGMKIELFYFFPIGWIDRALAATKDTEVLFNWWGRDDWSVLRGMNAWERALLVTSRIQKEFGYTFVTPWPICERSTGGRVMYFMIHATDHPEAPKLMNRAYRKAVGLEEPPKQLSFTFNEDVLAT